MVKKGLYPALLTPFNDDKSINDSALEQLIELNIKKGAAGFYVTGSTAEAFLLDDKQRRHLMQKTAEIVDGRCSLIAHVGCISTDQAKDLAAYAEQLGYDAVSAVPPFYYSFSAVEIKQYYLDILSATTLPMIIYNIPAFSGVSLTISQIDELLGNPQIIGVKNTANDYFMMEKMKAHNPDKLVFNGYDETFLAGLAMGADGAIGSTYNFMLEKFVGIYEAYHKNEMECAAKLQHEANRIIESLAKVGVMQGEKAVLCAQGIPMGKCLPPFKELTEEEKTQMLDEILPLL